MIFLSRQGQVGCLGSFQDVLGDGLWVWLGGPPSLASFLYFSEGNGIGFQARTRELTFTFAVLACPIRPFPQSFLLSSINYRGRHRWIIFLRWRDSLFSL